MFVLFKCLVQLHGPHQGGKEDTCLLFITQPYITLPREIRTSLQNG